MSVAETVAKHITDLRTMAADGRINEYDHDTIGFILCENLGRLIGLSNEAWEKFKAVVDESREVHYSNERTS
jgi:hypothetical protein